MVIKSWRFIFVILGAHLGWNLKFERFFKWSVIISVSDPDPCGSVLKWLPWIRIRIGNTDPDPGQSKWSPKRKTNLIFQVKKSSDHFIEGLMVFTRAWESSVNVFTAICAGKTYFYKNKKILIFFPLKNPGRIRIRSRIRIDLICWNRIRIEINTYPKHWKIHKQLWILLLTSYDETEVIHVCLFEI